MLVYQVELSLEVDTGPSVSVISESTYRETWPPDRHPALQPTEASLRTYTGQQVEVLGSITLVLIQGSAQVPNHAGGTRG